MLFGLVLFYVNIVTAVPNNGFSNSLWFILLTTFVIPVLMWFFSPQYIKNKIRKIISRNKIDVNGLDNEIRRLHLGIVNENQLSIDEFVNKYRYVFFPVVPNKTPNVIHITFINAIKGLEKLGFHVYVFIFDDYFCKVMEYSIKERNTYITNFVKSIHKLGINKHQILFESDFIKGGRRTKNIITTIYNITSKLSVEDVNDLSVINDHYLNGKSKYIRKFKSILNMTYPNCVLSKTGFVLSGEDEQKLWNMYKEKVDSNIVHLYIQALYTATGELSNVLDKNILSCEDSLDTIKKKISDILNEPRAYKENCSVFYLLNHNYFINDNTISFLQKDGTSIQIKSITALIKFCHEQLSKGAVEENTINEIAKIAYQIFHP